MAETDTKTAEVAPIVEAPTPVEPLPDPSDVEPKWRKALVWAGGKLVSANEKRGVVVVEVRTDDGQLAEDTRYPQSGDIYFRMGPDTEDAPLADFGGKTEGCLTLGENVQQGLLHGLGMSPGWVHVGPAHPAYAGLNLAVQQGASEVEIQGLTPFWKARLQPWIDRIATDVWYPHPVKVTLT